MRTAYELAGKYLNLSLSDQYIRETEGSNKDVVSVGSSIVIHDIYNYADKMSADPTGYQFEHPDEKWMNLIGFYPDDVSVGIGTTGYFVGYKTFQRAIETTSKAMLLSLLDGDSKRTTTVGVGSTRAKLDIFFNTLKYKSSRDTTIKPWSNWNDSVGICTPTSISRNDNVAIVTTTPAHGMTTSYDDWGVIMNLNTGIATSFNISTTRHPNGVPVKIIDANTFSYRNSGLNTSITGLSGTASIQVGWGGTSNNLHLYVY